MKQDYTSQEVLLVTGTSFSSRQWCKTDESEKAENSNEHDLLQEACWNGLIGEMLPEIVADSKATGMYLWKVHVGQSFIELEMGKSPEQVDSYFSIDPYCFITVQSEN
jgi:hypothetical protein